MNFMLMNFRKQNWMKNQNTIYDLMKKVQGLLYATNCMHDSKEFKDAESMHSELHSYVPKESASFLLQDDQGGLLGPRQKYAA